jgi:hypothetical protein
MNATQGCGLAGKASEWVVERIEQVLVVLDHLAAPSDSHAVSAEEATSGKMPDALGSRGSLRVLAS